MLTLNIVIVDVCEALFLCEYIIVLAALPLAKETSRAGQSNT